MLSRRATSDARERIPSTRAATPFYEYADTPKRRYADTPTRSPRWERHRFEVNELAICDGEYFG
jgi:hypothetical protein